MSEIVKDEDNEDIPGEPLSSEKEPIHCSMISSG